MKAFTMGLCLVCLLSACASRQSDHFYILNTQPPSTNESRTIPTLSVSLRVSLPSLVDRPEMVVSADGDAVTVMEHERWAAPLADLTAQTLAEDIEQRRLDLVVTPPHGSRAGADPRMNVDIVRMTARKDGRMTLLTHWRISDAVKGREVSGREEFSVALAADSYAAVAQALSACLALLADRLAGALPPPDGS